MGEEEVEVVEEEEEEEKVQILTEKREYPLLRLLPGPLNSILDISV